MQKSTEERYRKLAQNFYKTRLADQKLSTSTIRQALEACAKDYRPDYFRVLKNALAFDIRQRGHEEAADKILKTVNPTTQPNSVTPAKPKPPSIRALSENDIISLLKHLGANRRYYDVFAAVTLAWLLGVRPSEMETIEVVGDHFKITGAKKDEQGVRGADRTLTLPNKDDFTLAAQAVAIYQEHHRSQSAIRDVLRENCRQLWPRRKLQPTLKSLRHQLGANLKASGLEPKMMAYIMGHQSTRSIERYGDKRTAHSGKFSLPCAAPGADISRVRRSTRRNPAWHSAVSAAKNARHNNDRQQMKSHPV